MKKYPSRVKKILKERGLLDKSLEEKNKLHKDAMDFIEIAFTEEERQQLVDAGDLITGIPATFQINVKNAAGIFSTTVEGTTDGSSVTIINKMPLITNVSITSNKANTTCAAIGNTITLTFTSDEPVTKLSNFKINGSNPDAFTNVGNIYTATHKVDTGDVIGIVTFQINVKNTAGIYSQTIEQTTDGSSVIIQ